MTHQEIIPCRPQIADAISWTLIYQIMRRYQSTCGLRLYKIHPCSGQYDCLLLKASQPKHADDLAFHFNLPAQSLHIFVSNNHARFDIVDDYLHARDPKEIIDKISRAAGLEALTLTRSQHRQQVQFWQLGSWPVLFRSVFFPGGILNFLWAARMPATLAETYVKA